MTITHVCSPMKAFQKKKTFSLIETQYIYIYIMYKWDLPPFLLPQGLSKTNPPLVSTTSNLSHFHLAAPAKAYLLCQLGSNLRGRVFHRTAEKPPEKIPVRLPYP